MVLDQRNKGKIITMNNETITMRDSEKAFENALDMGRFIAIKSPDWSEFNWVGNYMYMYSTPGMDWFKHIDTRQYVSVTNGE